MANACFCASLIKKIHSAQTVRQWIIFLLQIHRHYAHNDQVYVPCNIQIKKCVTKYKAITTYISIKNRMMQNFNCSY